MQMKALLLFLIPFALVEASTCPYNPDASSSTSASTLETAKEFVIDLIKEKKGNEYSVPSRRANPMEAISQRFQIHHASRGKNGGGLLTALTRPVYKILTLMEGLKANDPDYLSYQRAAFGENFCAAGQVVLGEFEEVSKAITSPQARTFRLGTAVLDSRHLPGKVLGGPDRNLWVSVMFSIFSICIALLIFFALAIRYYHFRRRMQAEMECMSTSVGLW